MFGCWEHQIVVASSVMPSELAKALLEAGAKAVVCRRADAQQKEEPGMSVEFLAAFYERLLSGRPIVSALAQAGMSAIHTFMLCDSQRCCIEGNLLYLSWRSLSQTLCSQTNITSCGAYQAC